MAALAFVLLTAPVWSAAAALVRSGDYVSQQYFWRSAPRGVDLATVVAGPPMHGVTGALDPRPGRAPADRPGRADRLARAGGPGAGGDGVPFDARTRADGRRWLWVLGLFAVWALGPSLSIGGLDTGVLLPQTLARYVPIVANARIPGRAFVMVQLAGAVLVALFIARREWSAGLAAVLTAAVVCESLAAPFPLYQCRRAMPSISGWRLAAVAADRAAIRRPRRIRRVRPLRFACARASDRPCPAAGRRFRGTRPTPRDRRLSRHPGDRRVIRPVSRPGLSRRAAGGSRPGAGRGRRQQRGREHRRGPGVARRPHQQRSSVPHG